MELVQLASLVELLRNLGVTSYKNGDLELELGPVTAGQAGKESDTNEKPQTVDPRLANLDPAYSALFVSGGSQ